MTTVTEAYSFDDLMLVPQHGVLDSRKDADISSRVFVDGMHLDVPIISANMPSVTNGKMAWHMAELGCVGAIHRFNTIKEQYEEYLESGSYALISIGLKDGMKRTEYFQKDCTFFLLDIAHGDSEKVCDFVYEWKKEWPDKKLMVGNVATTYGAESLLEVGADAIKVGIGPGAACTTREVTGFGVPQLTAINWVAQAKKDYNFKVIADGGIRNSGDIVKALAAGADSVMVGKLLAGCDEAPEPGTYYGNASYRMNGHNAPEGVEGQVERTGSVEDVIKKLAWGIRSGISYAGANNINELKSNAEWVKVTPQTMLESGTRLE